MTKAQQRARQQREADEFIVDLIFGIGELPTEAAEQATQLIGELLSRYPNAFPDLPETARTRLAPPAVVPDAFRNPETGKPHSPIHGSRREIAYAIHGRWGDRSTLLRHFDRQLANGEFCLLSGFTGDRATVALNFARYRDPEMIEKIKHRIEEYRKRFPLKNEYATRAAKARQRLKAHESAK